MTGLYRREAIDYSNRRLAGAVMLATPLSTRVLSIIAVVVVTAGLTLLSVATFSQKETVSGWVAPEAGLIRVVARQGGIVEDLTASEGDLVGQGTKLASLRLSVEGENGDLGDRFDAGLSEEAAAVDAKARAGLSRLRLEYAQLLSRRESLTEELEGTRARVVMQTRRVELAKAEVERVEEIAAKGYLTRRDLDSRQSAVLSAGDYLGQLNAQVLRLERDLADTAARLRAIGVDEASLRADELGSRASISQRGAEAAGGNLQIAVAPRSGRVAALPFSQGQAVPAGAAVAVLTPTGSPLGAELYAPSSAAGFIRPGQEVRLMYAAFPYQKFGSGRGTVVSVSRTVLAPGDVSVPGLAIQEPTFRVKVRLASNSVRAYGQEMALQPGMLLTADIITSRRSLLEWLFDPLFAAGRRG